jgi:hypothetical protein
MERDRKYNTLGPHKKGWDAMISEFGLEIELVQIADKYCLGDRMYVMRIGDLCRDSPVTFNARAQAKSFFDTGSQHFRSGSERKERLVR